MKLKNTALLLSLSLGLASCHNLVFDDEGDCEVTYGLRFVYDMNLDWADAFSTLVNRVNLYAFDSNGNFVKEWDLTEAQTSVPGYTMTLDLPAGDYTLVAWGALETGNSLIDSFMIPGMVKGESNLSDLTCTLYTESNSTYPYYSDVRLPFLYQGNVQVNLPDPQDGSYHEYVMYLTKDTNHIRASVQKIGEDITSEDISLWITAQDKELSWDNSIISNDVVTYLPWDITDDQLTEEPDEDGESAVYNGFMADFTLSRMTSTMPNGVTLTLYNNESDQVIFRVPVIQYALTAKKYYEQNYGKTLTDQEFLDRQSEYFMTFFLDKNMNVLYTVIEILEWRVVIHNYDIDTN